MKKGFLALCMVALLSLSFVFAACQKAIEITEFTVEPTISAGYGADIDVKDVKAKDNQGGEYSATATVKDKNGADVVVADKKFKAGIIGTDVYVITYMVTYDGGEESKTTKVTVTDSIVPVIKVENKDIIIVKGKEFDLSMLLASVTDNSGESIAPTYTVEIGGVGQVLTGTKFTPSVAGDCEMVISAKDSSNNSASSVTVTAKAIELTKSSQMIDFDALVATDIVGGEIVESAIFEKGVKISATATAAGTSTIKASGNFEIFQNAQIVAYLDKETATLKIGSATTEIDLVQGWNIITFDKLTQHISSIAEIQDISFTLESTKAISLTVFAVYGNDKATVKEFVVPEIEQGAIGANYTLTQKFALFTNGFKVNATAAVKVGNVDVTPVNNIFQLNTNGTYVITYTAASSYLSANLVKTTEIEVSDLIAPVLTVPYGSDITTAEEFDMTTLKTAIEATDNSGLAPVVTYSAKLGESDIAIAESKFPTVAKGKYIITVTATDLVGNSTTKTITLNAISETAFDTATQFYANGDSLAVADFMLGGEVTGLSLNTEKVQSLSTKSLEVSLSVGGGLLSFENLAIKFIDDNASVEIVIYSEGEATLKLWGRGTKTFSVVKGWNILTIEREDFKVAFYSANRIAGGQYQTGNGANIGSNKDSTTGNLMFEFTTDSAMKIYLSGVVAQKGDLLKTDILDMTDITIENYNKNTVSGRGCVVPVKESSATYSLYGSSLKISNNNTYVTRSDAYFYFEKAAYASGKDTLTSYETVSFVFYYDKQENNAPVYFTTAGKKGAAQYFELSEGVNIITYEKANFAHLSSDGTIMGSHDGAGRFYYYLQTGGKLFSQLPGANGSAYDVYLMAMYGIEATV